MRSWTFGANPGCDVVVDVPTVSARHCQLTLTEDRFVLEDLGSTNGTFVNGRRIYAPTEVSREDAITLGKNVPMPWPVGAQIAEGKVIRIGRTADNDVVLDYPMVSTHHARIVVEGHKTWIEDLGSTNGTAIGSRETKIERAPLSRDDAVYFGSLRVPAARLLKRRLTLGSQPHTQLKLQQETTVLGRGKKCDRILDDPRVSRRHARLTRSAEEITVEDLGSANGTFVNGERIDAPQRLRPGDIIGIGRFTFKLTPQGDLEERDYRGNVAIEARGVVVEVPGKRLLENISLVVYPSEFVGLMGPSGAGKTTLMNALNGYTPPTGGSVLFNGQDLYANYEQFQGVMGYVPQDDIMHRDLTVGEALYYTARLRLPSDFSDSEISTRISEVIGQLGLEGTREVLIGSPQKKGISGGQRKRVNLAMELLTDPSVLFLDEPTSGLSSEDALMVMKLLRKLADEGKTIVLTIHQPSLQAYRALDNLILVGKDAGSPEPGRLVYYGPAYPQAVEFFNPEGVEGLPPGAAPSPDEVLRGLAKEPAAEWVDRYDASPWKKEYVDRRADKQPQPSGGTTITRVHRAFGFSQWWTLVRRSLAIKIKDRTNTAILLAQAPIIAILVALVFGKQVGAEVTDENWASVANATSITVFLLALAALWFGCSNSAREIVSEWAIFHRERMVNLKIPSYVGSKLTVLGMLCVAQCAVLLGTVHLGAGLKGPWLGMFLVLLLTSLVGQGIGLTVSALARTSEVAIALLPLILLPMIVLAGVLQPVHKMNSAVQLFANVMPSRWAFEGLLLLEVEDRPTWTPPAIPPLAPEGTPAPGGPAKALSAESATSGAPGVAMMEADTPDRPVVSATSGGPVTQPQAEAPSPQPAATQADDGQSPEAQDMAERFFPKETERFGVRASVISLGAMLILLVAGIHVILHARDVH